MPVDISPSKPGMHWDLDGNPHPAIGTLREQLARAFADSEPRNRPKKRRRLLNVEKLFRTRTGGRSQ